ncbi:hypothetical protein [Deminuibacter soli]|uniref:Lipocalin-like domain-containing protein n=1 Tax=Deminuibacter soli TaxID=2291815 RepID=A0A3E1NFW6_9BACT|nr:hypothetical protein [Deminuibacter soli]RFM26859.1 hypothetical protein DXN05_17890 [Deminuibacter soli]
MNMKYLCLVMLAAASSLASYAQLLKIDSVQLAGDWHLATNKIVQVVNVGGLQLNDGTTPPGSPYAFTSLHFDYSNKGIATAADGKEYTLFMTYQPDGVGILQTPLGNVRPFAFLMVKSDVYLAFFQGYKDGQFDAAGSGECVAVYIKNR